MSRLAGKVALITGGARGQGRAIAEKFAEEGADIVLCDLCEGLPTIDYTPASREDLMETRRRVEILGQRCIAEVADVRNLASLQQLADRAVEELGKIDILCANAGIAAWIPFTEMTEEQWREMIDVNLTGVFLSAKAVVPHMIERMEGCILITSSVSGREAGKSLTHYVASKHGLIGLMKNLALELGTRYGIRVNAVLPAAINTTMGNNPPCNEAIFGAQDVADEDYFIATRNWHALRNRPSMAPTVVADAMVWLASEEARYVTGIELPVDAGHLILPGFNHDAVVEGEVIPEEFASRRRHQEASV